MLRVFVHTELPERRHCLRGKRFVEFDNIDLINLQACLRQRLARSWDRTDTHDPRFHAGGGPGDHPGEWFETMRLAGRFAGKQQRTGPVVDARCVTRRDRAVRPYDGSQFLEPRQRRSGARMLVARDPQFFASTLQDGDRHDLFAEAACFYRRLRPLLASEGKGILIEAADTKIRGHILGGLRHGIDAILCFEFRVDEAPAEGRIVDFGIAAECCCLFGQHERCPGH